MPFLRRLDWVVGWYFLHFSHQAGVTCSGQRLEHRISPNVSFCLSVDCSGYTRLQSRSRLSEVVFVWHLEHLVTRMYKFPYNLIFFPTPIFFISSPKCPSPPFFSALDILPNSLNIMEKIILLPLFLFTTLYSLSQPCHSLPLLIFFPNILGLYRILIWPDIRLNSK